MAKFYMAKRSDGASPIAINIDRILTVEPMSDDVSLIRMDGGLLFDVNDSYENVVRELTPFIPFDDMVGDRHVSDWLQRYLTIAKGESNC